MEHKIMCVEDFEPYVGSETLDRIYKKAAQLAKLHVINFNSTYYGGGVAEMLTSLTLLMNGLGIKTEWRVIQGTPQFFNITKKMHNALQGGDVDISEMDMEIYERVIYENAIRNFLDHHRVVVHDPQPLPIITHYDKHSPWIWRCHIDLTNVHPALWEYLVKFVDKYDAVIMSCREYAQPINTPQVFFLPAINPFNLKNKEMTEEEIDDILDRYDIPTDLPLVAQISRFDPWKDPKGVIEAFNIARKEVDSTLVLLGNFAADDPEGTEIFESIMESRDERILVLSYDDTLLVNSLQRRADVVLQKSIREGFGLTVTEAMWKGTPVIGGNVGGIRYQIVDGHNGFLVSSIEETAERLVELLKDAKLREEMGARARETVVQKFLMTRYLEQYLDLFNSFETIFQLNKQFNLSF